MANSLVKDIAKTAKNNAVKGIGKAVFGTGAIGGALGKSFTKKFGGEEGGDTRVADALDNQSKVQEENSAILTRIETIVMNIADNVYNLAGIMNAQVVSMRDAQRIQQERAFAQGAAREENSSEALKLEGPKAAAGPIPDKKGGIKDTLKGIMDSIGSTKKLFKGFLKKFGVLALGITAAMGVAAFAASDIEKEGDIPTEEKQSAENVPPGENESPEKLAGGAIGFQPSVVEPPGGAAGTMATAGATGATGAGGSAGAAGGDGAAGAVGGNAVSVINTPTPIPPPAAVSPTSTFVEAAAAASTTPAIPPEPPAATPAAPPPSISTSSPAADPEVAKLQEYFEKPENAAENAQLDELHMREKTIKRAISSTKSLMSSASTPEEKAKHANILKNQLEPGLAATKAQKKAILDKARKAVGIETKSSTGTISSSPSPAGGAESAGAESAPASSASSGGGGGGMGASGSAATPVSPSPSTGASIGQASTSVAAASEPKPAKNNFIESNTSTDEGSPPPTAIPSPIAGRGSLDVGTVFGSES
jgi:hypothetical protein